MRQLVLTISGSLPGTTSNEAFSTILLALANGAKENQAFAKDSFSVVLLRSRLAGERLLEKKHNKSLLLDVDRYDKSKAFG